MDVDAAKRAAGEAAAGLIGDGARVGLGTGTTAYWFIVALANRVRAGLRVSGVATSEATDRLAGGLNIPLMDLDGDGLDIAVDGADVVDSDLRLIKGGGGAMVREKIVAAAAQRFVVVIDDSKLRDTLGGSVPAELLPFGVQHTLALLDATGGRFRLRSERDGTGARSDNGNLLADGEYPGIDDPEGLAARLDAIPGVLGHGLFLGMTDLVIVGYPDGHVEQRTAAPAVAQ
jgi:ribose 5-phosphate isomerase A